MSDPELDIALSRLDYRAIAASEVSPSSDLDRYLAVRALLVLGRYNDASEKIRVLRPEFAEHRALVPFLELQAQLYRRENRERCLIELLALGPELPSLPYFQGEYYFILGYLHNVLDKYKQGSRYHRRAVQSYLAAGRKACAAVALFNLCVVYDHLNERSLLNEALGEMAALDQDLGLPAIRVLSLHFGAYRNIDREDYTSAVDSLLETFEISIAEKRRRESGAVAWLILYLYLKLGQADAFTSFCARLAALDFEPTAEYQWLIGQVKLLSQRSILSAAAAGVLLRQWRKKRMDSIPFLFLSDLVLERLVQGQEYEAALKLAHRAHQTILERQMALSLLDFRYYEALCLLKLGDHAKGHQLLHAYQHDAIEDGATSRIEKARLLEERFSLSCAGAIGGSRSLLLDTERHEATVGTDCINLSKKCRIEQLLVVLIREGKPLTLDRLFWKVYHVEYSPFRHERRLNSLIDRARLALHAPELIIRRDGAVGLAPSFSCTLKESAAGPDITIQKRQQKLIEIIHGASKPLSISELERHFDSSRRTLQFDLNYLIKQKRIGTTGGTNRRCYFAERVA